MSCEGVFVCEGVVCPWLWCECLCVCEGVLDGLCVLGCGLSVAAVDAVCVQANSFFVRFFVSEATANTNRFPSPAAEQEALIYNYAPVYTGANNGDFEQCYLFE